jgi:hypothetical protein
MLGQHGLSVKEQILQLNYQPQPPASQQLKYATPIAIDALKLLPKPDEELAPVSRAAMGTMADMPTKELRRSA